MPRPSLEHLASVPAAVRRFSLRVGSETREGGREDLRPGPGAREAQAQAARMTHEAPGHVQEAVPEALRLAGGELRIAQQ